MKETVLKSVHIAFDEQGEATIQIQHAEQLWVEGEMIRETYLPHERLSLLTAEDGERARIMGVLGEIGTSHAEQAQALAAHLESVKQQAETERAAAQAELEATRAEMGAQLAGVQAELEVAQGQVRAAQNDADNLQKEMDRLTEQVGLQTPEPFRKPDLSTLTSMELPGADVPPVDI